eukprot:TRINITY_DN4681_c0_g1_i2.p3 TRINITY_DN4681_c0_g1~~TRINITY_DN4681_c0_g1_i2.p3  ORF type:complete len:209 (+),score=-11.14 TRINITY_DN4681_c0_g1_i2:316-942(+)
MQQVRVFTSRYLCTYEYYVPSQVCVDIAAGADSKGSLLLSIIFDPKPPITKYYFCINSENLPPLPKSRLPLPVPHVLDPPMYNYRYIGICKYYVVFQVVAILLVIFILRSFLSTILFPFQNQLKMVLFWQAPNVLMICTKNLGVKSALRKISAIKETNKLERFETTYYQSIDRHIANIEIATCYYHDIQIAYASRLSCITLCSKCKQK